MPSPLLKLISNEEHSLHLLGHFADVFSWERKALNSCCGVNERLFVHHPEDRHFFFSSVKIFNLSDRLFPRGIVGTFPYKGLMKPLSVSWNADGSNVLYQTKACRLWSEAGKKCYLFSYNSDKAWINNYTNNYTVYTFLSIIHSWWKKKIHVNRMWH